MTTEPAIELPKPFKVALQLVRNRLRSIHHFQNGRIEASLHLIKGRCGSPNRLRRLRSDAATQELLPGFRQLGRLYIAGDAPLELGLEYRACPVNHNDIFPSFGAKRVRHTSRNHNADVVVTAVIVAVDEKSHHPPRQS